MTNQKHTALISPQAEARAQQQDLAEREEAERIAKRNHNFLQLSKNQMRELRRLMSQSPIALELLLILAEKMDRNNAIVMSQKTMTEFTGWSRQYVNNAIRLLKKERWIQVLKIGAANAYVINSAVFWQSYGNRKHAVFNAQIIASASEQEESIEELQQLKIKTFPFVEIRDTNKNGGQVLIEGTGEPPDQSEMDV